MKEKKILYYLDISSFIALIVSAALILVFQSQGGAIVFKFIALTFMIANIALFGIYILFCFVVFKKDETLNIDNNIINRDEIVMLSKKQKIALIVKTVLFFVVLSYSIFIFFTV